MVWFVLSMLLAAEPDAETTRKVRKLVTDLNNEKSALAWVAAEKLGAMGPEAKEAVPDLRAALKAKSAETRSRAAAALILIDPAEAERAFPVLREAFKDHNLAVVHLSLIEPLGQRLNPSTGPIVTGLLQLAGEEVIWGWVVADMTLKRVEKGNRQVVPALEKGLKDSNLLVRVLAARCLGRVDPARVKDVVPVLREGLRQPDVEMRVLAAEDLLRLDPAQLKHVIEALGPGLREGNEKSRCRVAVFLLELDPAQAEQALPVLGRGLKTSSGPDVLRMLGQSLQRRSERVKLALPLFEAGLESKETAVRVEALRQLGMLGPQAQALEKQLREASTAGPAEVATAAVEALIRLRPERAADRIHQLIELAEKRDRAAQGAGQMLELVEKIKLLTPPGMEETWALSLVEHIDRRLKRDANGWHREELLRLHAIVELGNLAAGGSKAAQALLRVLKDRPGAHDLLRGQAAVALGRLGKEARAAIPALNRIARDETEALDLRLAARAALAKIDRDKDK